MRATRCNNPAQSFVHFGAWILLLSAASFAGEQIDISAYRDPADLIRKAVQNEIKASDDENNRFLFRGIKTTPAGSTTRIYVETKEATAGLIIGYNGKSLTLEQQQAEEARVERFINHPEELRKKRAQEHENAERTMRIMRAMPNAFLFEYTGEEAGSEGVGRSGTQLVKLKFHPNPDYDPPTRVEEVLTGMEGVVLIDPTGLRIAKIDGTLFKEVAFGWGILGHLDRGGRFTVQQQEVGGNAWEISSMGLHFTGKILLVKTFNYVSTEVFSGFKRVSPDLTFAKALELLKKEEAAAGDMAANGKLGQK